MTAWILATVAGGVILQLWSTLWSALGLRPAGREMATGFALRLAAAFLVTWLLGHIGGSITTRVVSASVFGLAAGIVGRLPEWSGWRFPAGSVVDIFDLWIGWTLAGFAITAILH